MKLIATPDEIVDRYDRAIWLTLPFDAAFESTVHGTWQLLASDTYYDGAIAGEMYLSGASKGEIYLDGMTIGEAYLNGASKGEIYLDGPQAGQTQPE